jgi:hypothetical protein
LDVNIGILFANYYLNYANFIWTYPVNIQRNYLFRISVKQL